MIELKNVSFSYGKKRILNDISLTLANGTLTAVVGENGCGKTTLLRLIASQIAGEGEILIDGVSAQKLRRAERAKKLSYFPQGRPTPDMRAIDVCALGRYPYNKGRLSVPASDMDIARAAMVSAGAEELCDRNMNTLSFGERQKVYLAMQIAQGADNCLLDEPTNFLDASARFSLLDTLLAMRDGGRCVVCVLHDVSLALAYADRIVTLAGGKVFFDGTPEEQYASGRLSEALGVRIERCGSTYAVLPKRDKGEL